MLSDSGDCGFRSVDMKTYPSKSGFEIVTWIAKPLIFASILMLAWAGFGVAQEKAQDALGVVHRDDMDIIFEPVGTHGLSKADYQAFDEFASEHPEIAKALERDPRLINDKNFVQSHISFADFLRTHPNVATDFAENPGNYVEMPVAVAASVKKTPIPSR